MKLNTRTLLGVPITTSPVDEITTFIEGKLLSHTQVLIFTPNPEIVVQAQNDKAFSQVLSKADINLPDGKGVGLALGVPVIPGREFIRRIFTLVSKQKGSLFVLVGKDQVLSKSLTRLKKEFPSLTVAGAVGPRLTKEGKPLNSHEAEKEQEIIRELKKSKPTIVFVGFGAPKQEKWIARHAAQLPQTSFMAVGGSFDYYAREKKTPPRWVGDMGIEWLWRLTHEKGHIPRVFRALVAFPFLIVWTKTRK